MKEKSIIESHLVPELETPIRLQEYGVGIFKTLPTKSGFKKAIKKELIFVNDTIGTTALFIKGGETITLYQVNELPKAIDKLKVPLKVHYEDDFLAVIEKPPGVVVSGNSFVTIYNALPQNLQKSTQPDAIRPTPIHRLDYPTSGLLLIGKTSSSIRILSKLFENKEIRKAYYAISIGKMESEDEINLPLENKKAITQFKVEQTVISERFEFLNLVQLFPITGRKHQLRKHLFSIGNPILGDREYHLKDKLLKGKGLYLHANSLQFTHPFTQEKLIITSELPKKFKKIFP
ncbi:pseudouridine synthase [Tenacibaculum holothuriorum]|uniref:Pseudouridine synthase n=1 Tax=Tenacibaculum holothuriorum TaxID=1635173 RepID=A0A1Y2PBA4_9FLAO|nr:RluA family pseudouridine synthase [Tenacibaculum holothuriorum]OSY87735.1 pseudouridine synthase [Tenacibaculum holothuriorum]